MTPVTAENYQRFKLIADEIDGKLRQIKNDTAGMSTHLGVLRHPQYAELLAYGKPLVGYLIHKMLHEGSDWSYFFLLHDITGEDPVGEEHRGYFIYILIDWLKWYTKSDYWKKQDVYFGLLNESKEEA